jgi:hypothetical protein
VVLRGHLNIEYDRFQTSSVDIYAVSTVNVLAYSVSMMMNCKSVAEGRRNVTVYVKMPIVSL